MTSQLTTVRLTTTPMTQDRTKAPIPEGIGLSLSNGQRAQTKVSSSIATKIVAASGSRIGNNPPVEENTALASSLAMTICPRNVSSIAATMNTMVFTTPAPARDPVSEPGKPCHHAATTTSTGSQKVVGTARRSSDFCGPGRTANTYQITPTM